jgi:hypothetical protein
MGRSVLDAAVGFPYKSECSEEAEGAIGCLPFSEQTPSAPGGGWAIPRGRKTEA